jgi:hypothetical protein
MILLFYNVGKIKKYDSPLEVLKEFCSVRLKFYEERLFIYLFVLFFLKEKKI